MLSTLCHDNRSFRIMPNKRHFGPRGLRLFVDYLDLQPGFVGRIDFIHAINITQLFEIVCSAQDEFPTAETRWCPEALTMTYENNRVRWQDKKYITRDDCAVSHQVWENKCQHPITLELAVAPEQCTVSRTKAGHYLAKTPTTAYDFAVGFAVGSDSGLEQQALTLAPGETAEFTIVAAAGNLMTETEEQVVDKLEEKLEKPAQLWEEHQRVYQSFFEEAPVFHSSDALLNQTWNYRWYILHNALTKPDFGNLNGYVMYEGGAHRKGKEPFEMVGWEFSKLINLSTPLHITDFKWHSQKEYLYDMIRNMIANTDENGIFCSSYVNLHKRAYANFSLWAVWQLYLVDGNKEFMQEVLPALKEYFANESKTYSKDDNLQIETTHNATGKEYQPSYWYFHEGEGYPENPRKEGKFTPLKRVDRSVYHYLNGLGLANLCEALGDEAAEDYRKTVAAIGQDIQNKMWDEETGFFYDLHHETDEKAMVKNIVGIYPYWAEITKKDQLKGLELLFDPEYFGTQSPFPTTAKDCPVMRPEGGWMGTFLKGRDGCIWAGSAWPYTTGIAIDAIGKQSKENGHKYDQEFSEALRKYSLQHFRNSDIHQPYLVEHYNSDTGEALSDEVDYNHSYYLELILSHVAGITLSQGGVHFDPIDVGLDYFTVENIGIQGDTYTVQYKKEGCNSPESKEFKTGYYVYKNGEEIIARESLLA